MRRKVSLMLLIFVLTMLSGCGFIERVFTNDNETYRITFVVDGMETEYYEVTAIEKLKPVEAPIKENYTFEGWFTKDGIKYDFSLPVRNSFYLYAKFTPDYGTLINTISQSTIKANVEIQAKSYNTILGRDSSTSFGSGIIIDEQDGYYYVLTNSHVVYPQSGYKYIKYTIEDYIGNSYTATVYNSSINPNYDLATLRFKKTIANLNTIELAKVNPVIGEEVIAIGQPKGQNNAITFGQISAFRKIDLAEPSESSTVAFPVIAHNAPTDGGSSGGALLSISLKLVGVSFAGSKTDNNEFKFSYAIPIEKVWEYLTIYVYTI